MVRTFAFVGLLAGLTAPVALVAQTTAPATPTAAAPAAPNPADKMRCKRTVETGSLAKIHKECHTEAEWHQMADQQRSDTRYMVEHSMAQGSPH